MMMGIVRTGRRRGTQIDGGLREEGGCRHRQAKKESFDCHGAPRLFVDVRILNVISHTVKHYFTSPLSSHPPPYPPYAKMGRSFGFTDLGSGADYCAAG